MSTTDIVGVGVTIGSISHFEALGMGTAARSFSVAPVSVLLVIAGLLTDLEVIGGA